MTMIERRFVDKSEWGDGPWQNEPDKIQFKVGKYDALIVRSELSGALCGYLGVPEEHPWYGKDYSELEVSVHGGLTYAAPCQEYEDAEMTGICHVPVPGDPDNIWWLGFDTAHLEDVTPAFDQRMRETLPDYSSLWPVSRSYKNVNYIKEEIQQLALQAEEAKQ